MKNRYYVFSSVVMALSFTGMVQAQCPAITCPGNITTSSTNGQCGAIVNFTPPVGTDPCAVGSQTFNYTGSMQTFTVPAGVTQLTIEARGAQGGDANGLGGKGAMMKARVAVTPGQVLNILVGQKPPQNGGGGGSFVVAPGNTPLVVAGGGGGGAGSCCGVVHAGDTGTVATSGTQGINASGGTGAGGVNGNGGARGNQGQQGGAGGGFLTNGANGDNGAQGGSSYLAGGAGGATNNRGGYGGGGSSHCAGNAPGGCAGGGGGGYSGGGSTGGGGQWGGGGGGGSYYTGTLLAQGGGVQTGNGQVILSYNTPPTTTQTAGLPSGSFFPVGTTTQTFQASNLGFNAQCSFTITVVDNENPTITCMADTTVNNDPGVCGAVVNYATPVGSDNCSAVVTQTAGLASGSLFPIGITTQSFTVTDPAGHTATCSFNVTVVDNEAPTVSCPANVTSCLNPVNNIAPAGSSDNCSSYITYNITGATTGFGNSDASGTTFNVGTSTVTYTATDPAGNFSSCSFNVVINPSYNVPVSIAICQGDSTFVGGAYQTTPGTYTDMLQTVYGCDSIITTQLVISPAPVVTVGSFAVDSVCLDAGLQTVPQGNPLGGVYSGNGIVNLYNFDPGLAGVGTHWIYYSSSDANGCSGKDSTTITVLPCTGVPEKSGLAGIDIYPNPSNGFVTITLGSGHKTVEITVMETNGRVVMKESYTNTSSIKADISDLSSGMYFLQVKADGKLSTVKVMKN